MIPWLELLDLKKWPALLDTPEDRKAPAQPEADEGASAVFTFSLGSDRKLVITKASQQC